MKRWWSLVVVVLLLALVVPDAALAKRTAHPGRGYALYAQSVASGTTQRLDGAELSGAVSIRVEPTKKIRRVRFYLDDAGMTGTPRSIDDGAPFELDGGVMDVGLLGAGQHTLVAVIELSGRRSGTQTVSAAFAVATPAVASVNDAPMASDDVASGAEDSALTVDVLANDGDPDGDALSIASVTDGANGSVSSSGGKIKYAPRANFNGKDAFAYSVTDGRGGTASARVTVTITPVNDAPQADGDSAVALAGAAVTIDVLANDSDVDGDELSVAVVTGGRNGSVADNGDGSVTFTPSPGFSGSDSFTYRASDGVEQSNEATVVVTVTAADDTSPAPAPSAGTRIPWGGGE